MNRSSRYTRFDVDDFSRVVQASRERARALRQDEPGDTANAMAHLDVVVEELAVADEELRVQTDALEEAQLELEIERRRYVDLFDAAPDPYLITDLDGLIVQANQAAGRVLAVPIRFLECKPLVNFVALDGRKHFREMLDHVAQAAEARPWDLELVGRDNSSIVYEVHVSRAPRGKVTELRWLLRDVTERRLLERRMRQLHEDMERRIDERTQLLEEALTRERAAHARAVTADRTTLDFITRLSHELRTPLQAAVGYVDILKQEIHGAVNAGQAAALDRISHAHHLMRSLLESILEIGRVRAGQIALRPAVIPVGALLGKVEELLAAQVVAQGLSFTFTGASAAMCVRADPTKLEQIVLNLVTNAIRYTPRGGAIALGSSVRGAMIAIEVRDTGPGIPRGQLQAIFEPFVRLPSTSSGHSEGSGLGLAISRELARLMGGDLVAESEVGEGSTFTLTLPNATPVERPDER